MRRCRICRAPLEGIVFKILNMARTAPANQDSSLCQRCKDKAKSAAYICQICNRPINEGDALTHIKAEEYLLGLIKKDHPEWKENGAACRQCVDYYRELVKKARI